MKWDEYRTDTGCGLIARERARQQEVEGYTDEHDDTHTVTSRLGALAYIWREESPSIVTFRFPCLDEHKDEETLLVQAGALIAAELDRRQRAKAKVPA